MLTASSATNSTLTNSQIAQAVTVANDYATTAESGAVTETASATTLAQYSLSSAQIQWVEWTMAAFDNEVQSGTVPAPVSNTPIPLGLLASVQGVANRAHELA